MFKGSFAEKGIVHRPFCVTQRNNSQAASWLSEGVVVPDVIVWIVMNTCGTRLQSVKTRAAPDSSCNVLVFKFSVYYFQVSYLGVSIYWN